MQRFTETPSEFNKLTSHVTQTTPNIFTITRLTFTHI